MRFDGIVNGRARVQFSAIWSMPDEPVEDWEPGIAAGSPTRRLTRITVDGDPRPLPVDLDAALFDGPAFSVEKIGPFVLAVRR